MELMPLINRVSRAQLVRKGARSRMLVAHGHDVHVMDLPGTGSGPPMVVMHGLGSSALAFAQVLPRFARAVRRVLAIDLPGAGFSPVSAQVPSIETCVRIHAAVYERELAGERAVIFGNSLGGAMAAELVARRPDLARALVLSAPAGAKVAPERFAEMVRGFQLGSWRDGRALLKRLYHHAPPLVPELLGHDMFISMNRPSVRELLHGDRPSDHLEPELLATIQVPILVLWSKHEKVLPYEGVAFFRANLPKHAVIEEVDGWGHVPHLEQPRELAERVTRFIAALPGA